MFVPVAMQKVNIFVSEADVVDVIVALGRFGALDLIDTSHEEGWETGRGGRWSELSDRYGSLARRLSDMIDVLELVRDDAPQPDDVAPRKNIKRFEDEVEEIENLVHDWQERRQQAERHVEQLDLIVQGLHVLAPLGSSVEEIHHLEHLHLVFGAIPRDNFAGLQVVLFRIPFIIAPFAERDGSVFVLAASAREDAPIMDRALKSAFFDPFALPEDETGLPGDLADRYEERLNEGQINLEQLRDQRTALAKDRGPVALKDWREAQTNARIVETISRLGSHGQTYVIPGWVPQNELPRLLETVDQTAQQDAQVEIIGARAMPREQVPTLLKNPRLLRPFEQIVSVFGFPGYAEIDPTPIVALTYVLMYGMMFGDLGHGLLLVVLGLVILWLRPGTSSLAWIMVAAGGCAALFGLLYGSVFGLENVLPHLWLQPLDSITTILLVSVAAGVGLLNVGFVLHLVSAGRVRDWTAFFFSRDGLAGFVLYWVLLGGVLGIVQGASIPLILLAFGVLVPATILFFRKPLARLVTGERPLVEQGWAQYSVESFFELFEAIVSYISNSISFVRLGAFAVAHAGLSLVMFSIANRIQGAGHWAIIALGTALIVGFEGLIVAIQALRLEYYEFFGKFLSGGGHPFRPFRLYKGENAR
jgi:V/A-type H+-transporting ATPase subunit I